METFHTTVNRVLSEQDKKQNIAHPVRIPQGTTTLKIRFSYAPQVVERVHNLLTLTVLDPDGFRGEAHRHEDTLQVTIQETAASVGFFPGAIQPGEWQFIVNTHMIMPGYPLHMRLEIVGTDEDASSETRPAWKPGQTASRGPGWYRGDLHAHTVHSDASWDVPGLVAFAHANFLDFITLSDHNTVSALAQFDASRSDDLLTIGGVELTTFWGHALALGRREWVDWRITAERTMAQIETEVSGQGGLFIIAHPEAIGDPYCTGCRWLYPDVMPGQARVVEVWNDAWTSESDNEAGLKKAFEWMNQGLRMALSAGTDHHGNILTGPGLGFNVVYAQDLSEDEILRAIRSGRSYLSRGPILHLDAYIGNLRAMLGDVLLSQEGEAIELIAKWDACPPSSMVDLILDGERIDQFETDAAPSAKWDLAGGKHHWALLTLRNAEGEMLALTNPIYFDGRA
jgi:hypothetical protein